MMETSGQRLRRYRLAKMYSQKDLAEAVGCKRTYISKIECGDCELKLTHELAWRIADFFGCSVEYLLTGRNEGKLQMTRPKDIPATRLKALRLSQSMSAKQVAATVGIAASHLSNMEAGRKGISDDVMAKLAAFYNVERWYFSGAGK